MQKQSSARDYFTQLFVLSRKLWETGGLLHSPFWARAPFAGVWAGAPSCFSMGRRLDWRQEGFWWGLLSWSIGVFGILLALTFVYLLFMPLLRAC